MARLSVTKKGALLLEQFNYQPDARPKITKVTLNMGVGEAINDKND